MTLSFAFRASPVILSNNDIREEERENKGDFYFFHLRFFMKREKNFLAGVVCFPFFVITRRQKWY